MFNIDTYKILIHSQPYAQTRQSSLRWHDCGEGPWDNQQDAVDYATRKSDCRGSWLTAPDTRWPTEMPLD